jgi:hypothetical protein
MTSKFATEARSKFKEIKITKDFLEKVIRQNFFVFIAMFYFFKKAKHQNYSEACLSKTGDSRI